MNEYKVKITLANNLEAAEFNLFAESAKELKETIIKYMNIEIVQVHDKESLTLRELWK